MRCTFVIDYLPESALRYISDYSIAAIDVIRATTVAATAVAAGHPCYFAVSVEEAYALASTLDNPLLAGELEGIKPEGFDINNSPVQLMLEPDRKRPVVMLSSSGTRLLRNASSCKHAYVACLRNFRAVSRYMTERHHRIAIIGAGSRGAFRKEDQMCCAWLGKDLIEAGYVPENAATAKIIDRWGDAGTNAFACAFGASAVYLERTGQLEDLIFILEHVNDLNAVFAVDGVQVVWGPQQTLVERAAAYLVDGRQQLRQVELRRHDHRG